MRCLITTLRGIIGLLAQLGAGQAETPLTPAEFLDGLVQLAGRKIGPQGIAEIELGVGQLPKQEVADAVFAAGPNQQIGAGRCIRNTWAPRWASTRRPTSTSAT